MFLSGELEKLAGKEAKYDAYSYVTYPGAAGVGYTGCVCWGTQDCIHFIQAYGPNDCNNYEPPKKITNCTKSKRIALTAEVYHVVKSIFR